MSVYENGFDSWLRKGNAVTQVPLTNDTSNFVGASGTGGSGVPAAKTDNPINNTVPASDIQAGEIGSLLGHGKKTFDDTQAGILFGLDTDGIYKWIVGDADNSADWAVTTAATFTVKGTITATAGTIGGWTINSTSITDTAGSVGLSSAITAGDDIRFWAGNATPASAPFKVTEAGVITATSGTLGGWVLGATSLSDAAGAVGMSSAVTGGDDIRFWAGHATPASSPFYVTEAGVLTATSGTIGGWILGATYLTTDATTADANVLIDKGNTLIRLGPTSGDYLTLDGANLRIRSSNYVSGFAGAGFTLEPDLLEVGNIACRGIFRTYVLQKDVLSVNAGSLIVAPGADVLDTDMDATDADTLTIKGTSTFSVGDLLRIKDGTDDEWFEVTNVGSAPTYTVTRDKNSDYSADDNPAWKKGASVVNYGQTGDGGLYLTASDTNNPYLSVYTHAGSPWSALTTRLRLGNLNGYLDYSSDIYGLAVGSSSANQANITIDPTNGLRIRTATTSVFAVDNSGNASLYNLAVGGSINVSTSGNVRSGQTAYNTGTGWFMEYNSGTPRLSIGDTTTTNSLLWDGSSLSINGSFISNNDVFGDGSDGDTTIAGNTTLTTDKFYDDLTVNNGVTLNTGGYRVFVRGTLTNNGTISRDGGAGNNGTNAVNDTAGAAGAAVTALTSGTLFGGYDGQAGENGGGGGNEDTDPDGQAGGTSANTGDNSVKAVTGNNGVAGVGGGAGGDSDDPGYDPGAGGTGAAGGTDSGTIFNKPRNSFHCIRMFDDLPTLLQLQSTAGAGGAGAGGGGASGNNFAGSGPVGGGGGGSGSGGGTGGIVGVYARNLINNGTISAIGGDGGDGGNGADGASGTQFDSGGGGGAGGGAGANGGVVMIVYSKYTDNGTISVAAGTGGAAGTAGAAGGASADAGTAGTAGNNGTAGTKVELQV